MNTNMSAEPALSPAVLGPGAPVVVPEPAIESPARRAWRGACDRPPTVTA